MRVCVFSKVNCQVKLKDFAKNGQEKKKEKKIYIKI